MKIVCVSGGSYKSFYLNHFNKIKNCDLMIFNFGIIYDYVVKDELLDNGVVTKELLSLSNSLKAVVVAGVNVVQNGKTQKALIVSDGEKIYLSTLKLGVKVCLNMKTLHHKAAKQQKDNGYKSKCKINEFVIGCRTTSFGGCNKIVFTEQRIKPVLAHCNPKKIYIFCNNFGVSVVQNKQKFDYNYKVSIIKI